MKIIGITGKSGSGKTTFASLLAQKLHCNHIDIDKIGHQALFQPEILNDLCDKFGKGILYKNGNLDRKKIGDIVFSRKDKMKQLSDLTWDYMEKTIDSILAQDDVQRKNKVLERDNISEEYFEKRDSASIDYSPFEFDYVFENDYKQETMKNKIQQILM